MTNNKIAAKPLWQQLLVFLLLIGLFLLIERQILVYQGKRAIAASGLPDTLFAAAMEQSQQSGKPVLANFSAIWCSSCRRLERKVLANAQVRERILAGYHYTRLEYENDKPVGGLEPSTSDRAWFNHFGVSGFPTLLVIDGESIRSLPLTYNAEKFLQNL